MLLDDELYPLLAESVREVLGSNPDVNFERLGVYRFALGCAGVKAELRVSGKGIPYLLIDTGVKPTQVRRITANRSLVVSNGTLLLPLRIQPETTNFIHAWYSGAKLRP